ncbi:hypothetical protein H6P81_008801 [Aristolochia fimbriata]|uniref:Uncharacterized protein n=1 Tax=Aristolochia fimbriata TaxID=158543 RepID=A0AAV7EKA7_ARIFI|nr:hypothetical protein H6P81_008801 [Aristolochia fimbriata]
MDDERVGASCIIILISSDKSQVRPRQKLSLHPVRIECVFPSISGSGERRQCRSHLIGIVFSGFTIVEFCSLSAGLSNF